MLEINKNKEISIKKIFGTKKFNKWLKAYPILKNADVMNWLVDMIDQFTDEGKDADNFYIIGYLKPLYQYCLYNKVNNPTQLLEEEIDARNSRLKKYLSYLLTISEEEAKKLSFRKPPSEVTIRNMLQSRIKSFYSNRGVPIGFNMKTKKSGANIDELILTKEIIKQIQSKLESIQYRLIFKFESQTGLRIGDILEEIPCGKYKIEKYQKQYFIRNFETQKEKVIINFLFFTQELADLVQSAYPEKDLSELDLKCLFKTRKENNINKNDYLMRLKEITKELGINGNFKTHSLRKYFTTSISAGENVDNKFNFHIEGRESNYRDVTYDNNLKNINWYYEKWLIVEKKVCVDCIVVDKTNKEVIELKKKMIKKDEEIESLLKVNIEMENKYEELKELYDNQKSELYEFKSNFLSEIAEIRKDFDDEIKLLKERSEMPNFKEAYKNHKINQANKKEKNN